MSPIEHLIHDLGSADPAVRDAAAVNLMDSGDARVVNHLLTAICKPGNENHCGTLVHALSAFNCSEHVSTIVRLALAGNYEASLGAYCLLEDMEKTAAVLAKVELELESVKNMRPQPEVRAVAEIRQLFLIKGGCTTETGD